MQNEMKSDSRTKIKLNAPEIDEYWPRIPSGEYDAICYAYKIKRSGWGNDLRLFLNFRIFGGKYDGTELFMPCTYDKRKLKKRSKLYEQYMILLGRRLSKKEKLYPKMFKNKMYLVKVRDTNPKYQNGTSKPDMYKYSVVDRIIDVQTGKGSID